MQETLEIIFDLLRGAWRFRIWALVAAWAVCLPGWFYVAKQGDVYEAQARVLVNTSSELRQVLDDQIVDVAGVQQLRLVHDALLGTERLEQLIRETELAQFANTPEDTRGLVEMLRASIEITSTNDNRRRIRPNERFFNDTYTIAFTSHSREGAVNIVSKLLELFQRGITEGDQSVDGEQFLLKQKEDYERRLRSAEKALADFNRENFDRLPSLQGGYFQQLREESTELETARTELRLARTHLNSLDQQLRGEAAALTSGDVAEGSLEARIRSAQMTLDELLLRYTTEHPEVVIAEALLAKLRSQQDEQTRLLSQGDLVAVTNNPIYEAIRLAQNEARTDIARLEANVSERETRLARLRGLIDEMPVVEAELAQLTRDTQVLQAQYQALLESLERERLSRQVSQTAPLDFQILDPPSAGQNPIAPNRPIQYFLVFVFAVGLAGGLAIALDQLMPVYSKTAQLAGEFEVIGAVSQFSAGEELSQRMGPYLWFGLAFLLLCVAFVSVLAIEVRGPGLGKLLLG